VVGGDLLVRLAATDRLHGDSGLNSGLCVRRLLSGGSSVLARYPALKVNDRNCS